MDDVIVIGGSAAGTAAAIYLARRHMKFRMVSLDFGGEVATSGEIGNWPGIPETNGIELTDKFLEHLRFYKIEPELDVKITSIKKLAEGHFVVEGLKNGNGEKVSPHTKSNGVGVKYEAKAVIVGTGSHPRELGIPGEKELRGKGLSYCTVCDGPLFPGKITVVIGGGDSANESGIMLNEIASKVYVLTKNPDMKGDPSLIARLKAGEKVTVIPNAITTKILGDGFVSGVEYKDANTGEIKTLEAQGVFVHIGMIPNADFLPQEVNKNNYGEIVVDKNCETSVKGLYAAGDVTDMPFKQIGVAVGQGICAGLSAVSYVNRLSL